MKVAFIGAGSVGFTRKLLSDIFTVPEFKNIEVSFTDINQLRKCKKRRNFSVQEQKNPTKQAERNKCMI